MSKLHNCNYKYTEHAPNVNGVPPWENPYSRQSTAAEPPASAEASSILACASTSSVGNKGQPLNLGIKKNEAHIDEPRPTAYLFILNRLVFCIFWNAIAAASSAVVRNCNCVMAV